MLIIVHQTTAARHEIFIVSKSERFVNKLAEVGVVGADVEGENFS